MLQLLNKIYLSVYMSTAYNSAYCAELQRQWYMHMT